MHTKELYWPAGGSARWEKVPDDAAGVKPERLREAVAFVEAHESPWPRSFYYPDGRYVGIVEWNETGPWSEIVGPVRAARRPGRPGPQRRPHRRRVGRHARAPT